MKSPILLALLLSFAIVPGCSLAERSTQTRQATLNEAPTEVTASTVPEGYAKRGDTVALRQNLTMQQVSLNQAHQSQTMAEVLDRKILRNADLNLEVSDPATAQYKITSIVEVLGGFVVLSESKQQQNGESGKQDLVVNVVVRVPAAQFDAALNEIRSQGQRVIDEKTTGQDVTEEFIDLEARIRTQKALELQFLEIMKQARKVEDALEVQRQVADVRTEIEKLEGRKRFLESKASLSTITIKLQTPKAIIVTTSGFGKNVKEATADSVAVASAIVLFLIRFVIVMIPILVLIILPGALLARFLIRRNRRMQLDLGLTSSSDPG